MCAYKRISPQPVIEGGTGAQTLTAHGVLIGEGTAAITALAAAPVNSLLQGQGAADPSFQTSPSVSGNFNAAGIVTGGTGLVATIGNIVASAGSLNLPNTNAAGTQGEITLGGSKFVHNFGTSNTFIGSNAGNLTLTVANATANTGVGIGALQGLTTGTLNQVVGYIGGLSITSGSQNCGFGGQVFASLLTGVNNCCFGYMAGANYSGAESNNILLGIVNGVTGESNVLRIGASTGTGTGQINQAFISGIFGITTVSVTTSPVLISNTGQLGTIISSRKVKDNIVDMGSISSQVMKLRPVVFNFKAHTEKDIQYGFIAEEVAEIMPNLATYDESGYPMSVRYHDMPAILLNEMQKQQKVINDLLARIIKLEGR